MQAKHVRITLRSFRHGMYILSALLFLCCSAFTETLLLPVHADGVSDLLQDIPVVNENSLNNAACGVASATMILDYYRPLSGSVRVPLDIHAVANYVKEDSQGTSGDELQTGIEAASASSSLQYGNPLKASWLTTDSTGWFAVLKAELDSLRPVIVYIPNGRNLGWNWSYPHYIVVSGYTGDDSIIYHDPWDGKQHTLSNAAFANAWGTVWRGYPSWWYLQVIPSQPVTRTPLPTPVSSSTTMPVSSPTRPLTPTTTSSPTSDPTVPVAKPSPEPTSASSPATLEVSPTNLNPHDSACTSSSSDGYLCTVTISEATGSQGNLQWSAHTDSWPQYSTASGTLSPGQSKQITIFFDCGTYTLTYVGQNNTVTGMWSCAPSTQTLIISPTSLFTGNTTNCQQTGTANIWQCFVTLTENSQASGNINWSVSSDDSRVQLSPQGGQLAPGQSTKVYLTAGCFSATFTFTGGDVPVSVYYASYSCVGTPTSSPTQSSTLTPTLTAHPTLTPSPTLVLSPSPTQPPVMLQSGTWKDPYGGANYNGDSVTLQLVVQGSTVTGTMTGDLAGVSTAIQGQDGVLSSFSSSDQQFLNYVIQNYGTGTGIFLVYTTSSDFEGVGTAGSTYYAVLQPNGSLQGFWYLPNTNADAGSLNFNPVS